MANNSKLEVDIATLDEEYLMLKEEMDSLDELFEESKNRLDQVAKVPTRANPVFMSSQTANLISIKEKKISLIKELTAIKKSKIDIEMKVFSTNNKLEDTESGVSKDVLEIYRLLSKADKSVMIEEAKQESLDENNKLKNDLSDNEIEDIFAKRLALDDKDSKKQKKNNQTLPSEYSIVVTKNKELYIIDEYYNVIEDCDFDTSVINITKFDVNNEGEDVAYDEDGNVYEVVEFD